MRTIGSATVGPSSGPRRDRGLLNAFLVSVVINAGLGIWALLSSDFGQTQGKVLATSFCVSGGMLGLLVNGAPLARRVRWPLPLVAAGSAIAAAGLSIVLIWAELDDQWWWKSLVTLLIITAGGTLVGLLALLALRPGHEILRLAHAVATSLLAGTSLVALWAEVDTSWMARSIGVESVMVAALTLIVPALARFQPPAGERSEPPPDTIVCPTCGTHLDRWGRERPTTTT